ncbi:MAG: VWA domain-containing protein [Polyangiaceae bacterium]|nr:VWA domain-containing protein [Polyangiaceae bacterium]MCE7890322.1 VWA domain-containing protein [Sorangiineae bacterium PRO1]MCL4749132.1 von Willebrand factor type A domain-containing protein [Myxococcales bacterium]
MNETHADTRVTAYALGELDAAERAAFEAELAESAELREELLGIESTLSALREELGRKPKATLDEPRRERIRQELTSPKPRAKTRLRAVVFTAVTATAMAAGALFFVKTQDRSPVASHVDRISEKHKSDMPASPPALASAASPGQGMVDEERKVEGRRFQREAYDSFQDNPFIRVATDPRSTFSVDVDTASYALIRRHLNDGQLPPKGAVRIEEMINYFSYAYPEPEGDRPFSVSSEVGAAPWAPQHRLLKLGLKGKHVAPADVPGTNLVFLIDTSGSMSDENKLPLLKRAFELLVQQLDAVDRVSIVAYAGSAGMVLGPTPGNDKRAILGALERLDAGGSTNGGQGIELAYKLASEGFVKGGVNRVILATDGDFNVGVTNQSDLVELVEDKAKSGVFLSVLGFGSGNYNDSTMEKLADKGNGNYAYVDTLNEAKKVLVEQATGTLLTIAKDVKIQIEFNPSEVSAFRLIGYENRVLSHQDFNDDRKDAGEIGADHSVTALYEIVPAGRGLAIPGTDPLKYQTPGAPTGAAVKGELGTVKLRYKLPDASESQLLEVVVRESGVAESNDFRFAAAVAQLGMLLRDSPYRGSSSYSEVVRLASSGELDERRRELLDLARKAEQLRR